MSKGDKIVEINNILKGFEKYPTPYYFIGAGISRRYIDTPSWEDLLKSICEKYGIQFNRLLLEATGGDRNNIDYSVVGSHLKNKLTELKVTRNPEYDFRKRDALKEEIVELLREVHFKHTDYMNQVEIGLFKELLSKSSGVVTTNYDLLIEDLLCEIDFESYIGQKGIIGGNISFAQEIYKIHGCVYNEESIVITKEDYDDFLDKQKYLLGKLIVIFTEYPIIFLGYSISDKNIRSILKDLSLSLSKEELEKVSSKWIFVDRKSGENNLIFSKREISITTEKQEKLDLIFNCIETDNYEKLYSSLNKAKNFVPANKKIIKYMRKILKKYEFDPEGNIKVNFDSIDTIKNFESAMLEIGVSESIAPSIYNITQEMILSPKNHHSEKIKKDYLVSIKSTTYYPRYYLNLIPEYLRVKELKIDEIKISGNLKIDEVDGNQELVVNYDKIKALINKKDLQKMEENIELIHEFLVKIYTMYKTEYDLQKLLAMASNIRKIACVYDYIKYKNK